MEFLHVTLDGPYMKLTKPFDTMPPENLVPLAECIGNRIADYYQDLVPRAGELDEFSLISVNFYSLLTELTSLRSTTAGNVSEVR